MEEDVIELFSPDKGLCRYYITVTVPRRLGKVGNTSGIGMFGHTSGTDKNGRQCIVTSTIF